MRERKPITKDAVKAFVETLNDPPEEVVINESLTLIWEAYPCANAPRPNVTIPTNGECEMLVGLIEDLLSDLNSGKRESFVTLDLRNGPVFLKWSRT